VWLPARDGFELEPCGATILWWDAAVDDGEYVGLGSTIPIWCRRLEKLSVTSSGSGVLGLLGEGSGCTSLAEAFPEGALVGVGRGTRVGYFLKA